MKNLRFFILVILIVFVCIIIASKSLENGSIGSYSFRTIGSDLKVSVQTISKSFINDIINNYSTLTSRSSALKDYPKIMIVFDDGFYTTLQYAYPILSAYNFTGTVYVITGDVDRSRYLSVDNMTTLYNADWDIANHGREHVYLTTCTTAQQEANILGGMNDLDGWGFTRSMYHFAYPYGDYNGEVKISAQKVGTLTARKAFPAGHVIIPQSNLYDLNITLEVINKTTFSEVKRVIEKGKANETIVLLFHHITPYTNNKYNWSDTNFKELTTWMYNNGYQTITISQWYTLNGEAIAPVVNVTANITTGTALPAVQFLDTDMGKRA